MRTIEDIKKKALNEHIPIIMDDTLEVVSKVLQDLKPKKMLEIGTAVGYSAICFSKFLQEKGIIDTIERDVERYNKAVFSIKKDSNLTQEEKDKLCAEEKERYFETLDSMREVYRQNLNNLKMDYKIGELLVGDELRSEQIKTINYSLPTAQKEEDVSKGL